MPGNPLENEIERLKKDVETRDQNISTTQKELFETKANMELFRRENTLLQSQVSKLLNENQQLKQSLEIMRQEKPSLKSGNLIHVFQQSITKMQEGLKVPDQRVGYTISNMDVQLKTNLVVDKEGELSFQLPTVGETIEPESLSSVSFTLRPVPLIASEPDDRVEVPNLVGVKKEYALDVLQLEGLTVGTIAEIQSMTTPNLVIKQSPEPFSKAPRNTRVNLVVSKADLVKTPNLIGIELEPSLEILKKSELLTGKIVKGQSPSTPNTVIGQDPAPETLIKKGSKVDLVVAKPEETASPNLVGLTEPDASTRLEETGLKTGKVTYEVSEGRQGTVIKQSPPPGQSLPVGSQVDIVVSKPKTIKAPDLTGMNRREAESLLKQTGLSLGTVTEKSSIKAEDSVLGQEPAPRSEVAPGSKVNLVYATNKLESIKGIDSRTAPKLRRLKINSVADLANSSIASIRRAVGASNAEKVLTDARLVVAYEELGKLVEPESLEALVKAGAYNLKTLAEAEAKELYQTVSTILEKGDVKLKENYRLTVEKLQNWIESVRE
jgi:beta-lactam-binding protein with PASTA domain